mmetsp:Transcript_6265/g.11416  ORF Transcript_6265/g.11416 Transcript_6265/m.11416 type:complete len:97 (-) Transcript_6265:52-342(-)
MTPEVSCAVGGGATPTRNASDGGRLCKDVGMTKAAAMRGGPVGRIVVLANAADAAASIRDGGNIFIFASIWMRFFRNKVHRNEQECSGGLKPGVYW